MGVTENQCSEYCSNCNHHMIIKGLFPKRNGIEKRYMLRYNLRLKKERSRLYKKTRIIGIL